MTPATRGKQSSSPWRSGCASTRGRTGGFPFLRARSASERPRWPAAPTRPSTPRRPRSFACGTPLRSLQPSSGTPPSWRRWSASTRRSSRGAMRATHLRSVFSRARAWLSCRAPLTRSSASSRRAPSVRRPGLKSGPTRLAHSLVRARRARKSASAPSRTRPTQTRRPTTVQSSMRSSARASRWRSSGSTMARAPPSPSASCTAT
mmetsp:Transcript_17127/g.51068  ORF Transcript_17127/g.51068 Transcript_17127/m.51068 type:complete len:205 (-) Transcript_17127:2360-2974(-)